ncbi:hypothetical protein [Litorihabitans aurantiacus]|uniref:Uncharacterized protein n=1 Tax=Litorihabitans aurantiacus TaxID=1930061 RepID=A0AA38CU52_9MICO|nr:hypothetical protein [Litorihabitans aurantiacus]GMA33176.1 hypothetical protein GCM10025875_31680 [Litorihabitans aurantiacus]
MSTAADPAQETTVTPSSRTPTIAGAILLVLGLLTLVGAAGLVLGAGFRLAPASAFDAEMTVELEAGEHAVYVTPSDRWSDVECTGALDGEALQLRPDMTLQDVALPRRWDARGSFSLDAPATLTLTCAGPVGGGEFTVGPAVSLPALLGAAFLGVVGLAAVVGGVVGLVVGARRRRSAS